MTVNFEKSNNGRLGIWLFIASEAMLFGGLFVLYSIYRFKNPADFHFASAELSLVSGTINTCILITSSLFAALSLHFLKMNDDRLCKRFLFLTIFMALCFLVIKSFEWSEKFQHGLYPGADILLARPKGEILFFGLYFMMTGLHVIHVIAGIALMTYVYISIRRGRIISDNSALLENSVLYWHLVDIIWIYLFPLFYLIA
jgi:cytochrome c oxidase subunit III